MFKKIKSNAAYLKRTKKNFNLPSPTKKEN